MQDALSAVEALAEASGSRLRKLDRKAERALVSLQAQALRSQLARENDPAAALSLIIPMLIAQVDGPFWPHALAAFRSVTFTECTQLMIAQNGMKQSFSQ